MNRIERTEIKPYFHENQVVISKFFDEDIIRFVEPEAEIMGSDSYKNLPKWKNFEFILEHYPIYVYLRPGHQEVFPHQDADVTFLQAPLLEISATHIRNNVREGRSIRYLVPDKVMDEILRNGYYRN